jgi:hypothetical protein
MSLQQFCGYGNPGGPAAGNDEIQRASEYIADFFEREMMARDPSAETDPGKLLEPDPSGETKLSKLLEAVQGIGAPRRKVESFAVIQGSRPDAAEEAVEQMRLRKTRNDEQVGLLRIGNRTHADVVRRGADLDPTYQSGEYVTPTPAFWGWVRERILTKLAAAEAATKDQTAETEGEVVILPELAPAAWLFTHLRSQGETLTMDALNSKLKRLKKRDLGCFVEAANRPANQPTFLYKTAVVLPILLKEK